MRPFKLLATLLLVLATACASVPAQSKTLIDNDSTQTLSNKTLDSSNTISGNFASPTVSSGPLTLTPGQIVFPATQNPSAGVNTLDDYEEGTWTPSVGGNATYTAQSGTYTKVGNRVFITCTLIIDVLGTGSLNTISGLLFAGATSPTLDQALSSGVDSNLAVSPVSLNPVVAGSTTTIIFYGRTAGATGASLLNLFGNAAHVEVNGSYRTN